jgi:AcrR family transcriptional regulator
MLSEAASMTTASRQPPQQERSRATLQRLLDATGAVLQEKPFDQASVAEIARRARTSVGAFYGRFPDKESLLDCFDEKFFEVARASCDEFFDSKAWRAATLKQSVEQFVRLMVRNHRQHAGVLRALASRGRQRANAPFQARADRHNRYVLRRLTDHLLSRQEPIAGRDSARLVELAFVFTVGAIREVVLYGGVGGLTMPRDDELSAELARSFLAYLQTWVGMGPIAPAGRRSAGRKPTRRARQVPPA